VAARCAVACNKVPDSCYRGRRDKLNVRNTRTSRGPRPRSGWSPTRARASRRARTCPRSVWRFPGPNRSGGQPPLLIAHA